MVIDMQNDFLTGSLALSAAPAGQDGLEILEPLNAFLDEASGNFDTIGIKSTVVVGYKWQFISQESNKLISKFT